LLHLKVGVKKAFITEKPDAKSQIVTEVMQWRIKNCQTKRWFSMVSGFNTC
jgi:hypothetical protein